MKTMVTSYWGASQPEINMKWAILFLWSEISEKYREMFV